VSPRWFRKRPVDVQAWQLSKDLREVRDIANWIESSGGATSIPFLPSSEHVLSVVTLEGEMKAGPGWWIIRGVKGEFYPCAPDIFAATYEAWQ